jgi:pimeloyl-ACP methyl ester carboxylesterase
MWIYVIGGVLLFLAVYLVVQGIRCRIAVKESRERLAAYGAETVQLSYGKMSYVDTGEGETILSVHGIFGGYDQAYDTCKDFSSDYRIIAPSRFGYLGSDVLGDGTPAEQAAAFVELLDKLGIDKVYVLATSAGGSAAIRFALDYPERTKGLILYSSAMPFTEKPEKYSEYAGPPAFLCNDFMMYLISPLFEPIMGMEPSTIYSMLPIGERKEGVVLDASVTNPDMARNYDDYHVEDLQVPTLVFHAKDDKLASYADTEKAVKRFPNCTFISFESGGHLMEGHQEEIKEAVSEFISGQ